MIDLKKIVLALLLSFPLASCSTHMTTVEYEGDGVGVVGVPPVIGEVIVTDNRGTESNWLGAIRGGYGNRLKTLRTDQSTDLIIDKMYTAALEKAGIYENVGQAPYRLDVEITKFDCSYFWNREAHAHVNVSLTHLSASNAGFRKSYKTDLTEAGVGAGVFGDVETLRDLAEEAMNETIDKMLGDKEFSDALKVTHLEPRSTKPSIRLKELKALLHQGLITELEYEEKRSTIMSEL